MTAADPSGAFGEARTRVLRVLSVAFGVGAIVFAPLAGADIAQQWAEAEPVWTVAALVLVYGIPIVLGLLALTRRIGPTGMKRWSGAVAVGYILCLATHPLAVGWRGYPPESDAPWLFGVSAIGTSAAAVAWRPTVAWIAALGVALLIAGVRLATGSGPVAIPALQDALYAVFFTAVFTALVIVALRASAELDSASASGAARLRDAAAARAEATERRRLAALTHDRVLVALSAAANADPVVRADAPLQAARALADMERFRSAPPDDAELSARAVAIRIRSLTAELAPDCFVTTDLRDDVSMPAAATEAIVEAASEAVRNSVAHADRPPARTHRSVHIRTTGGGVEISVLDDGRGFDLDAVARDRVGLRVSVLGRLRSLPGGSAEVHSTPGGGTRVVIAWRR